MFDVITFQIVKYPSALRNIHSKTELQQIKSIMNADTVRLQVPEDFISSSGDNSLYEGSSQTYNFKIKFSWKNTSGKNMNQFFRARKEVHDYVVKTFLKSLEETCRVTNQQLLNIVKNFQFRQTIFDTQSLFYQKIWKPLKDLKLEIQTPETIWVKVLNVDVCYRLNICVVVLLFKKFAPAFYGTTELKFCITAGPTLNLYKFSTCAVAKMLKFQNDIEKLQLPSQIKTSVKEEWESIAVWCNN